MHKSLIDEAKKRGYIDAQQWKKADKQRRETGMSEDTIMRESKIMTDEALAKLYADMEQIPLVKTEEIKDTSLIQRFNSNELVRLSFLPEKRKGKIFIYTVNPANVLYAEDILKEKFAYKGSYEIRIITLKDFSEYISKVYSNEGNSVLAELDISADEGPKEIIYDITKKDSSEVVNQINKIFCDAISQKISDIHFELQGDTLRIRFREDGDLYDYATHPISAAYLLFNRIKTMSNLDVNINKTIQDGNCRVIYYGKKVDLRISIAPALKGENIVIRILDQSKVPLDISRIGFSKENEKKFKKIITRPQGMILLTGPTGSGKSTSLYAAIAELNTEERSIITFEDPIEYRVPGIVQVQINPSMNVTFPEALKCGLRQDIEVALVGEIRDKETATIALEAANTGHMVFSTLHADNAASSIARLKELGVAPYMIAHSLTAVINQRLVKRICENCVEEYFLEEDSPYRKVLKCGDHPITMFRGKGCPECKNRGYKDRIAIHEFLIVDEEIAELIESGASTYQIEQAAIRKGMRKMQVDGLEKAVVGVTTLEEIHRKAFFKEI